MASRGSARLREASPVAPGPAVAGPTAAAAGAAAAPSKRRESPRETRAPSAADVAASRKQLDKTGAGVAAAAAANSGAVASAASASASVPAAASAGRGRSARLREAKEAERGSASSSASYRENRVELATRLPDGRLVTLKMGDLDDYAAAAAAVMDEASEGDESDETFNKSAAYDNSIAAAANAAAQSRSESPLRNGAPSPDGSLLDEEGDALMAAKEPPPSGRLSRLGSIESKKDEQAMASSSPVPQAQDELVIEESEADKQERAALLARRVVVEIPALKPRGPLITKDQLPRFKRPPLRHVVTEERRIVQVRPTINSQAYPEQLIDDTMTKKTFVPVPGTAGLHPQAHGSVSFMTPLTSSRSPLIGQAAAPGGTSLLHVSRHQSLTHSPGFLARKVSNPPNAGAGSAAMFDTPGSPKARLLPAAALAPQTPALHRQATQLTHPIPPTQTEGPPSNIVTQLIPYGRIEIVPTASEPVLCASMVPLSAKSTAQQWYLPRSQPSSLYVTLELPGHVDFEIRIDNVFVLPAKFDQQKLEQQQKLICEGKLVAVNEETEGGSAAAGHGQSLQSSTTAASAKSQSIAVRRGGHLQRKKCMKSELQQLLEQDESCMAESVDEPVDQVEAELSRDYSNITQFGPPTLKDVQVVVKSAGKDLVPAPAKVVQVPVREKVVLPSRAEAEKQKKNNLPVPAPAATPAAAAAASTPATGAAAPPGGAPVAPPAVALKRLDGVNTLPGGIVAMETKFIPKGPSTLSVATPHIDFSSDSGLTGSISLQRCKPRLGGWVVRRDISVAVANGYEPATLVAKGKDPIVKAEPSATVVKAEPGVQVKLEEGVTVAAPPAAPATPDAAAPADPRHPVLVDKPFSSVYEPTFLSQSQHDIAEVGDVIRLVIDVPAPALKPRYKPILAMHYELLIEGLRVLPTAAAPMFPTPLDMYRYGTAPKELVRESAFSTRLQSSVVPSELLSRNQQLHWSRIGLPLQARGPVVLPEALLPSSDEDSSDDENGSSSEEEDDGEEKKGEEKMKAPKPAPSPAKLAYQRLMEHPQQNVSEYYLSLETPLADSEVAENELLDLSESSASEDEYYSESDSASDTGTNDEPVSDFEYDSDRMHDASDEESPRKGKTAPNSGSNRDKGKTPVPSARAASDKVPASKNQQQPPSRSTQSDAARKALPTSVRPPSASLQKQPASTSAAGSSSKSGSVSSTTPKRSQGSSSSTTTQRGSSSSASGSSSSANNADSSMDYVATPEEVWACCDKCGKWRKLPPGIREEELPAVWFCHMNPDVTHNLCKHPEEQETQDSYAINPPAQTSAAASTPSASPSSSSASRKAAAAGTSNSSGADKSVEKEKANALPLASQAAQAAHLAMLFPCPRLPTVEDVCTTCEQTLLAPGQDAKQLLDTAHTLFCHGLCGRTWHRKCATVSENASRADAPPAAAAAAAAAPSPSPSGGLANINAPTPSTHVMPFQPLSTPYWYCNECFTLQGHCFSCFKPGTFDPLASRIPNPQHQRRKMENPDFLQQCPFQGGCGKLYHRQCLFELPRTMTHKPSRNNAGGKDAGAVLFSPNLVPRPRAGLICALHACDTCGSAGTASTNVRDIGRTLVHCLRCPVAYHWSTKCRRDEEAFKPTTKKFGVCNAHEETGEDAEDADVVQRRNLSIANLTLTHGVAPTQLFGTEPVEPEESSDDSDEEDEDEEDEDEGSDEPPVASNKNKADGEASDAPKAKKQRT